MIFIFFGFERCLKGTSFPCLGLDIMVDEALEAELMFVTLLCSIDVLDEYKSLRDFLVTLLLTISLATA